MSYPDDPGYEKGSLTSKEAAEKMKNFVGSIRQRCYRAIELHGVRGMTPDEGEVFFTGKHQTISARFTELAQRGQVIKTNVMRKTDRAAMPLCISRRNSTRNSSDCIAWRNS